MTNTYSSICLVPARLIWRKKHRAWTIARRSILFTVSDFDFHYALKVGMPELIEEIIKRTGAGIPIHQLAMKSGVEIEEKTKYYQGLSVHGKKRRDWADAGRGQMKDGPSDSLHPPLLEAVRFGSLRTVEWLLSDAPMRCYKQFAQVNKGDARLRRLSEGAGFEATTLNLLNA